MSEKQELIERLRIARERGERPSAHGADLRDANLHGADLRGAYLRDAYLRGADLRGAFLWGANLRDAYLHGADLRGANLRDANLWGGFRLDGLASGQVTMVPTCDGWQLSVGCWRGTRDSLRELIAQDGGWPEATVPEIPRRRKELEALLVMLDLHAERHQDKLDAVIERWGDKKQEVEQ